jgi:hypothetical protein
MATIMGHLAKMESVSENIDGQIKNMMDRREKMKKSGASTSAINSVTQMIKKLRDRKRKSNESVNELQKMRPAVKKLLKQKGYSPIFQAIDNSKRQFKQMRYSRGEIQDTLIDMFGDEDPKILQKIKESVNEGKLETLALNLLRNINKEAGVKKYDHTKTADFNKVVKFLKGKMPRVPNKRIGQIAMSYNDYRKKQPKIKIPDIDSVKDMEKTLKKLGMKEGREASIIQHHQRQLDALIQQYPDSYSRPYPIQTKIETLRNIIAVTKKKMGESINEDVYAIVDKFNQKKQDYDQVYFKDNNLNKVKKHMKKMGKKYGKMNLIKVKTNGKMSLVEAVSKSQAQEIMRQLGGRKFEMLMGVKSKGVGKDGLILHIGRNPKKVSHIVIDLDRGKDLYNLTFGKIFKYQFKVVKKLKGVGVEQLHDTIEKYTGLLTTFRKR